MINKSIKAKGADDDFISRPDLAAHWDCHVETLKRRERQGLLHPIRFSPRLVRYRLTEVRALEREAGSHQPRIDPVQNLETLRGWKSRTIKHKPIAGEHEVVAEIA